MLQEIFKRLATATSDDSTVQEQCWQEIVVHYSQPQRYYHNLSHLENLVLELEQCRQFITDHDTMLYAVFYHDIIYDTSRSDNEEQSAVLATERMKVLNLDIESIEKCRQQILATKTHLSHLDKDTNLFTDADLAILGKAQGIYKVYSNRIRLEYGQYPDNVYFPGRAKMLQHFLEMPCIYKTSHFQALYEEQARNNIKAELQMLS